jgi:RNA polymerase sigma-70 factor (ECF subfamily)
MTVNDYNKAVEDHADAIYRFVLKNLKDEDEARDIVQETFEKVWMKAATIDASKVKSYLFTTAYHAMLASIKRNKRFEAIDESTYKKENYTPTNFDVKKVINEAVSKLPFDQRSVIMLRDYEGYSYQEIGEITGLSESQVKVYIFRARTTLKNQLVSISHLI